MHLCDFGANVQDCPGGSNCVGPSGTIFKPERIYDFNTWNTRMYVRQALLDIFPAHKEVIHAKVDPGEYGMENYYCRLACVLLFMFSVMDDMKQTAGLITLLCKVPSEAENWIAYDPPDWEDKHKAKQIHGWSELDLVKFRVAGMPIEWKVVNFVMVVVPKTLLWWGVVSTGVHFLMETANIVDLVVNTMSLSWLLEIDEMIFERLTTVASKTIMGALEDYPLFDTDDVEHEDDDKAYERFIHEEHGKTWHDEQLIALMMPKRFFFVIGLTAFFVAGYYFHNCEMWSNGSFVSVPMALPLEGLNLGLMRTIFGEPTDGQRYWEMPSPVGVSET